MERLVIKSQTDLTKAAAKSVKNGTTGTNDVVELENANRVLSNEKKVLEIDVAAIESQYSNVAKAKLERRLKSGVDDRKLGTHQKQLDSANTKKEDCEKHYDDKIERLEEQKTALDAEIDDLVDAYRTKLKATYAKKERDIDKRIAEANAKKERDVKAFELTISYFQPLVDAYYETQPQADVAFPASYYKKKEQLEKLTRQIATNEMLINNMIRHAWQTAQEPESQEEITRRRLREQARREDMEAQREAEASQLEMECRENAVKRAAYEREAEARRARNKVRQEVKPVDKPFPSHVLKEYQEYLNGKDTGLLDEQVSTGSRITSENSDEY